MFPRSDDLSGDEWMREPPEATPEPVGDENDHEDRAVRRAWGVVQRERAMKQAGKLWQQIVEAMQRDINQRGK